MSKNTIFKLIALSLPLLFILILEVGLRLFGYGESYRLFHKVIAENGTEYYVMNSGISEKYFGNTGFNSDNQSDLFLKDKTPNTFRVIVQGASTVVGFPFYRSGSFPRMLKHRLARTFPDKNIEVVNTGMTAVNTYTLWDLTDEIIEQEPDLVIIYAGHNEYYGALGAGSSVFIGNHPFMVRTYLKLKNLRFFQLLEAGYQQVFQPDNSEFKVGETTLMEVMAREQEIPYGSDDFHAGINQFQSNIGKIIDTYQAEGIPVILSTIVSNEKDIEPFISKDLEENEFEVLLKTDLPKASKIAQNNAMASYKLGQFYFGKNNDSARHYFQKAKELDLLRFRAPERINEHIINMARTENIHLVDANRLFEKNSKSGIIDNELMTEHVHPNVRGNFMLADAFYKKIKDLKLLDDWQNYIPYEEAFRDIPVTRIDSIRGKLIVQDLKNSWPYELNMSGTNPVRQYNFIQNPEYEEKKAIGLYSGREDWDKVMKEAYHTYMRDKDYQNALRVAQSLISEYPEQPRVYEMAGDICSKMNRAEDAQYYYDKSEKLK
ncbi:hypothetical protein E0K83_04245 [Gramella sp. BOM4]|nr:hypothetical protein [Christiangramia bathymodioli]